MQSGCQTLVQEAAGVLTHQQRDDDLAGTAQRLEGLDELAAGDGLGDSVEGDEEEVLGEGPLGAVETRKERDGAVGADGADGQIVEAGLAEVLIGEDLVEGIGEDVDAGGLALASGVEAVDGAGDLLGVGPVLDVGEGISHDDQIGEADSHATTSKGVTHVERVTNEHAAFHVERFDEHGLVGHRLVLLVLAFIDGAEEGGLQQVQQMR